MDHQQTQRPRATSYKSQNSQQSHSNHERTLSYEEKHKTPLPTTKADPNAAMNESQPIAAALEKPTLQSLRSFNHTDAHGNPIAEPDLSNPTRSRWERPLDTIRSFEAAIDHEYRRRARTMRAGDGGTEVMSGYASRRSSYYGGGGYDNYNNRYSQASGHYANRQSVRDSYMDNGGYAMGGPVGGHPHPRSRYHPNRMQSDPGWSRQSNGNGFYPSQGYQKSRDTVHTNGSNGSHSDPNSADPSSDNSSFERGTPVSRPDMGEQYGFNGFGGGPIQEYRNGPGPNKMHAVNGANAYGAPPVPAKNGPPPPPAHNVPIKLGQSNGQSACAAPVAAAEGRPNVLSRQNTDKRKSWFKKRFSKE